MRPSTGRGSSAVGEPPAAGYGEEHFPLFEVPPQMPPSPSAAPRGLSQFFGLDPRIAVLTVVVDMMLFGGEVVTLGASLVISVPAGAILGYITYKAQRKWYGDEANSAAIKGLIVALLTAIPNPLPALLYVPAGVLGWFHAATSRKRLASRGRLPPL